MASLIANTNASFIFTRHAERSFSADATRAANHPVLAINWVKIIIGLSTDVINDRDFEQLTSITRSAPYSLLYLLTVREYAHAHIYTHESKRVISLILGNDVRVIMRYYLSY